MESEVSKRLNQFIAYKRLSRRRFQASVGVSNSYIQNISKGISEDIMNRILSIYPELNRDWLLTGEGEMLNPSSVVTQIAGDNNRNVNINGADDSIVKNLLAQIAEQQRMCDKFQQQIDRLLTIIEKKQ